MIFDPQHFLRVLQETVLERHERSGIGTYKESMLHLVLKSYYCTDKSFHEVPTGSFIADVRVLNSITEIQTSGFYTMKEKLEAFLPDYDVTVVYPLAAIKWVCWLDPDSGEIIKKNRSPKKRTPAQILAEIYGIRSIMSDPHLHFDVAVMEVVDYRLQDGYGKDNKEHATRLDRTPLALLDLIHLDSPTDFSKLLPYESGDRFTAKEFGKTVKLSGKGVYQALKTLADAGLVSVVGKQGRSNIYEYQKKDAE